MTPPAAAGGPGELPVAAELLTAPAVDVRAVSEACKRKILEREGIAMFVALHDARTGRRLEVRDRTSLAEGARLAELFGHYDSGLAAAPAAGGLTRSVLEAGIESADAGDVGEAVAAVAAADPEVPADDPTGAATLIDVLVVLSDRHLQAPAAGGEPAATGEGA